jgi:ABC-type uncharacterized transport system substrate-binding protein
LLGGAGLLFGAAELVRLKVNVIVAWFMPAALAAKQATREIPIVCEAGVNGGFDRVQSNQAISRAPPEVVRRG